MHQNTICKTTKKKLKSLKSIMVCNLVREVTCSIACLYL